MSAQAQTAAPPLTAASAVTALRVANEAFLVSSTIERCPKTMMIRELVVNAIEAASHAPAPKGGTDGGARRRVDLLAVRIEGVPKLCIRNTGTGLSAAELDRICDLASSLNKINSLDANFGMGAKVASLPSNKHGMRYRSCKDGVVSEVILCQRDGVYGRLHRGLDADGNSLEVIDATATVREEGGVSLDHDWTEVVLFGNAAAQNTVTDPYGGNPKSPPDWLAKNLLLRFFHVEPSVEVWLSSEVLGGAPACRMRTLADLGSAEGQSETVRTPSGVTIHYRYDPQDAPAPARAAFAHPGGLGCIVYKNEVFDPRTDARWKIDAPTYGISFGAKHISIFVELPDDYLVRPEAYRQFLRFRGGDQRQVFLHDFGQLVTAYIPAWLKSVIRSFGPQQAGFLNDVAEELRSLVEELDIAAEWTPPRPPAKPTDKTAAPAAVQRDAAALPDPRPDSRPATPPAPPPKKFERPPEIIGLDDDEMIEERGLKGRAAKFYPSSHQLFINLNYTAVGAIAAQLEAEFNGVAEAEALRTGARSVAGWAMTRRVARALIYTLTKKAAGWPAEDVKRAQSPESFSLVADDWQGVMEVARPRMEEELAAAAGPRSLAA